MAPKLLGVRHSWLAPLLLAMPGFIACGGGDDSAPNGSGGTISAGGRSSGGSSGKPDAGDAGASGANDTPGGEAGAPSTSGSGGTSGTDGGGANGGGDVGAAGAADQPPSCAAGGITLNCGPDAESCCSSLVVPGGQFLRSYDGVSTGFQNANAPASVTSFRLDKYEVTVGRFRSFVSAVVGSWRPAAGSGKREELNLGMGRVNVGPDGGNEPGWDAAWDANLGSTAAAWNTNLGCSSSSSTWTAKAGTNEQLPITCVDWYEALAFCIWDGGTLPTEAEWNEAAAGGTEQRVFPWSAPPMSLTIDCAHANYFGASGPDYCVSPAKMGAVNPVGSESPAGDGRWGQADMAGNVFEWVLDSYADAYSPSCPDCVYADSSADHVIRGGGYNNASSFLLSSFRTANHADGRGGNSGLRCARVLGQ